MAKVFIYSIILTSILVVLSLGGVPLAHSNILTLFGYGSDPADLINSTAAIALIAIIAASAALGGIVAGLFGRSPSESYVLAPFVTGVLALFITDMGSLMTYINNNFAGISFIASALNLILFATAVGFVIALAQFFRGNDI